MLFIISFIQPETSSLFAAAAVKPVATVYTINIPIATNIEIAEITIPATARPLLHRAQDTIPIIRPNIAHVRPDTNP